METEEPRMFSYGAPGSANTYDFQSRISPPNRT